MGKTGRPTPLAEAEAASVEAMSHWMFEPVVTVIVAGSVRRGLASVNDVDLLVVTGKPNLLGFPAPALWHVTQKQANRWIGNVWIEAWWCPLDATGPMLVFLTGPASLNVFMRRRALERGLTLSQYGLFERRSKARVDGDTEQSVFEMLELPYLEPDAREYWREFVG